jgi:hypothetical protein
MVMAITPYTLEQAEQDIGALRGQVDLLTEILKFTDSAADWTNTPNGAWPYSLAGHLKYLSTDGNNYETGHVTTYATTDQTISSTTYASTCNGPVPVGIGAYRVRAVLSCQQITAAVADNFRLGFTGTISQVRMVGNFVENLAGGSDNYSSTTTNNGAFSSPTYAVNTLYTATFDGIIVTTSTGSLSIQAAESVSPDTFKVLALSFFHLEPIS